jgi:RNA polymerase sigma-70 factor (ECF subfamily)
LLQQLDNNLTDELRQAEEITRDVRARVEPRTWEAFWLTAIEKASGRDVAAKLGMTLGAVYTAKRRVGQMLRSEGTKRRAPCG